ncbi:formaldehyde-activating enzyme [Methanopyrus kandleri]
MLWTSRSTRAISIPFALRVGEAFVGEPDEPEIAHIDLVMGSVEGPVGRAFAEALASPSKGHTPLLAVLTPGVAVRPPTLITPTVTIENMAQGEKIFGPVQRGIAEAVVESVEEGVIPRDIVDDVVIIANTFVHPEAEDDRRLYENNKEAMKKAIECAMKGEPTIDELIEKKDEVEHPLAKF